MSRVGADLVEAFEEIAAHLRGEIEVESYEVPETKGLKVRGSGRSAARWRAAQRPSRQYSRISSADDGSLQRARPQKVGCGDGCSASA